MIQFNWYFFQMGWNHHLVYLHCFHWHFMAPLFGKVPICPMRITPPTNGSKKSRFVRGRPLAQTTQTDSVLPWLRKTTTFKIRQGEFWRFGHCPLFTNLAPFGGHGFRGGFLAAKKTKLSRWGLSQVGGIVSFFWGAFSGAVFFWGLWEFSGGFFLSEFFVFVFFFFRFFSSFSRENNWIQWFAPKWWLWICFVWNLRWNFKLIL